MIGIAKSIALAATVLAGAMLTVTVANAARGKQCMDSHWHHGSSGEPMKSKKAALRQARYSWVGFTSWEYGNAWGSFKRSADKIIDCQKHPGRRWTCNVQARPCRR